VTTTVKFSKDNINEIKIYAIQNDKTRDEAINMAISEFLANHKKIKKDG
jgi:hypothetical protein